MRDHTPRVFVGATTFAVTGMASGHRERVVAAAIAAIAGVDTVEVDVASGTVTVTATNPVDRTEIAQALTEAGFTVRP